MQVSRVLRDHGPDAWAYYCPGCELPHAFSTAWGFDGNLEAPTLTRSVLATGGDRHCHAMVRAGKIEFLADCHHALVGQTVDMPELPDWMRHDPLP